MGAVLLVRVLGFVPTRVGIIGTVKLQEVHAVSPPFCYRLGALTDCYRPPRRREVAHHVRLFNPYLEQLETVQMAATKRVLRCSSTTSDTVLRAELGMHPLKTNRDVRKLK